ncbi:hypothetical protein [Pseudomonas sp. UMAB-40]|uniref:hypothetical protein n=1 Tax=Pseudomonas sp. UMAB-40 TaxID=1365407 RepID=UPI001C57FBBE|nr:hypothetical protein [Pseudomonas sp. UMAB-40]
MAAKKGTTAAAKPAAAKPAAAPKVLEAAEKSAVAPGDGAPADSTGTESEAAKVARETEEQLLNDAHEEAMRLNQEWDQETARVLAEHMSLLEDEAMAEDQERTERLKTTQTTAEEGADGAVTLTVWTLPEISEFPATVTLENHTRNRVPVAGANLVLAPYEQVAVEVTQEQFAKLAKSLSSSARAHKWDNLKGLQVKYDRKD